MARPQATFDGADLHPDLFPKAAVLVHAIIKNHPFMDGNKRTGVVAVGLFLQLNGHSLTATNRELESFTLKVATAKIGLPQIADWLRRKSR